MAKFKVEVVYTGTQNFLIEAANAEEAEALGEKAWMDGAEPMGVFEEDVEVVSAAPIEEVELQN